jgi:hypothetical protein
MEETMKTAIVVMALAFAGLRWFAPCHGSGLYTSTLGLPELTLTMSIDGKMYTFQISHRRAHPPRTPSDPAVTFALTLTGQNQAELANKTEENSSPVTARSD